MKTAVLLVNVGTPDNLSVSSVRKYLLSFLMDGRVITMHPVLRFLLVNLVIAPLRAPKSFKLYKILWTVEGSPLLIFGNRLKQKLQNITEPDQDVFLAFSYGNPPLKDVLNEIKDRSYSKLIIVPMFPQYASSTSGSVIERSLKVIRKWDNIPEIRIVGPFYNDPNFISAFTEKITYAGIRENDHVLFSFHGLPLDQVVRSHHGTECTAYKCTEQINSENNFCYQAACYETARLLAQNVKIPENRFSVCFQSRFSRNWLSPYTDEVIIQKAKEGVERLIVVCPSFVADCLETIVEIGHEYRDLFIKNGGRELVLVESLNDSDSWANTLKGILKY